MSSLNTSLYKACSDNKLEDVKILIGNGADINWRNNEDRMFTPLMIAVVKKHSDISRFLLTCDGLDCDIVSNSGRTLLWMACCYRASGDIVCAIAHKTSNQNINNKCGGPYTPIMEAVYTRNIEAVRVLGRIPRVQWSKEELIKYIDRYNVLYIWQFQFFWNYQ